MQSAHIHRPINGTCVNVTPSRWPQFGTGGMKRGIGDSLSRAKTKPQSRQVVLARSAYDLGWLSAHVGNGTGFRPGRAQHSRDRENIAGASIAADQPAAHRACDVAATLG